MPSLSRRSVVSTDSRLRRCVPSRRSGASLDLFIATLRDLAMAAKAGDKTRFLEAPRLAPRRRLDETRAARHPVLRWTKPAAVVAE
jgi:glycine cleavage system protein P-like pyridoxal-binding family